jgi:uncharacterized protein YjeT (DUF2065 family)
MTNLAGMSVGLGLAVALAHAPCALAPGRARTWLQKFPRSVWAGWILTAIDLLWVGYIVYHGHLGPFDKFRRYVVIAVPVGFYLVIKYVDELLAARALGGLFLLVPAPLLAAARWNDSALRLVAVVFAYVLVVKGIVLMLSPYRFRQAAACCVKSDRSCRLLGIAGGLVGLLLLLLGLTVY